MILYLIKKFLGIDNSNPYKKVTFELGSDDLLVLHCKTMVNKEQVEHLKKQIQEALNSDSSTKCIVLPYNIDYSIIKRKCL